jgi:hypothetical protein
VFGLEAAERPPRRSQAEEGMHAEPLPGRSHVPECSEGVCENENAPLRPPERDLPPEAPAANRPELEGRAGNAVEGRLVDGYPVPVGERIRVPAMPVEEHDDAGRLAQRPDPLADACALDRVDQPDPAGGEQGVGGARHGAALVDPPEAEIRLVAEADGTSCAQANTSRTLRSPAASRSISSGTE